MQKFLKSGNAKLYVYLAALILLSGLWRVGEDVNAHLSALPVKEAPKAAVAATAIDKKSFYPVWVKQSVAIAPVSDEHQIDSLFKREQETIKAKSIEPDYGQAFRQAIRIDGVADDGLFINGRFYSIGDKLEQFTMITPEGRRIVPKLEVMKDGVAIFYVGVAKRVAITLLSNG